MRKRLLDFQQSSDLPSYDTALRWSIQTAEGLAYIHTKGVLQGDIGCHNILLDNEDNVKLCDFGGSSIDGSISGVMSGKGFRRSNADPDVVDMADELFALGSTIYEIWTTRKPYHDEDGKTVQEYFKNQTFPADVEKLPPTSVIVQCWREQYTSASEVVVDLKLLLNDSMDAYIYRN